MIVWRGNGIWALMLVALVIVSAGKAWDGGLGVSIGLASAALLVFLLRGVWDEGASAFFVPVRFWPVLLLILAALALFDRRPGTQPPPADKMHKAVADIQSTLPRMLSDNIRAERAEYGNKTLRYDAKALTWYDRTSSDSAKLEQLAKATYCDSAKALVQNGVSVQYDVLIPPRSLNSRTEHHAFAFSPASCTARL